MFSSAYGAWVATKRDGRLAAERGFLEGGGRAEEPQVAGVKPPNALNAGPDPSRPSRAVAPDTTLGLGFVGDGAV